MYISLGIPKEEEEWCLQQDGQRAKDQVKHACRKQGNDTVVH